VCLANRIHRRAPLSPLLIFLLVLVGEIARAAPSVPWTPTRAARHALELLADEGDLALPLTQWPLPRAAVARALDALPRELPPALDAARARVAAELRAASGGELSVAARNRDEVLSGFGDESTPGSWLGARSGTVASSHVALQIGAHVDQGTQPSRPSARVRLDESAAVVEAGGVQLAAWAHRSWWGPGWQSSLLLGNNSPPAYGIGLQRTSASPSSSPWLSWMGPWTYELFVANNDDALGSTLVGTRLTMRPFSLLEIAFTRTAQWGGHGRPQSVQSFARMLVGLGANTANQEGDPANEMTGFDVRLRCPGHVPCTAYGQFIGEDATHHVPARFLGLYGLETWSADGRYRWFAEFAETLCGAVLEHNTLRACAYRNHAYPEGYANAGRWIGSAAGADSRLLTLGWLDAEQGTALRLHAGRIGARVGVFAPAGDPEHSGPILGASLRQSWSWRTATLGLELDWFSVTAAQRAQDEARVGLTLRVPF